MGRVPDPGLLVVEDDPRITVRSDPRYRATAMDLGAAAYFTKPFTWTDIWSAVCTTLASR
jgi:DNA-binding NarL/FixJ family response regulator